MNKTELTGRLGKEVELKKTANGVSICEFNLAVNDGYGDKKKTYWITCVAWRSSADFLYQYAKKGDLLGITGKLVTNTYENQKGEKVYQTKVSCEEVEIYSPKSSSKGEYEKTKDEVSVDDVFVTDESFPF